MLIGSWPIFGKIPVQDGFLLYAYYTGEAAKLENSEKSLTFAAQLFLQTLRGQDNPALNSWMATDAKELFEKALELNPDNDSSKVGLGASYIFGSHGRQSHGGDAGNSTDFGSSPPGFHQYVCAVYAWVGEGWNRGNLIKLLNV